MSRRKRGDTGDGGRRPQLQMWDDEGRETAIGTLSEDGIEWALFVTLEPVAGDLVRGRLSFRDGDDRHDTAPVLVERSAEAVMRRAAALPKATLRQLLGSARG